MCFEPTGMFADDARTSAGFFVLHVYQSLPTAVYAYRIGIYFGESVDKIDPSTIVFHPANAEPVVQPDVSCAVIVAQQSYACGLFLVLSVWYGSLQGSDHSFYGRAVQSVYTANLVFQFARSRTDQTGIQSEARRTASLFFRKSFYQVFVMAFRFGSGDTRCIEIDRRSLDNVLFAALLRLFG